MFYFIIGASGSGKTACLKPLNKLLPELELYDFDDIGVPENADKKWRQASTEAWLHKLSNSHDKRDACLLGQMVPAEIISTQVKFNLDNIRIILLDCSDEVRIQRLKSRNSYGVDQNTLNWAAWLRMHCKDPRWEPHVIKEDSSSSMNFDKWDSIESWGDISKLEVIDTSNLSIVSVASAIHRYITLQQMGVIIKQLDESDIKPLSDAFINEKYRKSQALFEKYLKEQEGAKRSIFVALDKYDNYLGYITVLWASEYNYFIENNIPEINDFNVIPSKHNLGIGSILIDHIEKYVAQSYNQIGLGVGLFKDYGNAQSLYVRRGYVPNKEGITYNGNRVKPFSSQLIDDDCLLWLVKKIG